MKLGNESFLITGVGRGICFACAEEAIAQRGGGVAFIDTLLKFIPEFHTLSERVGVRKSNVRGDVTQSSFEHAFAQSVAAMG